MERMKTGERTKNIECGRKQTITIEWLDAGLFVTEKNDGRMTEWFGL